MTIDRTKLATERVIGVAALVVAVLAPTLFSGFWLNSILTQALILGIGAASLIFLSAYGGMISLAQTGLMGIAGYALANMVTQRVPGGETKGLLLGWDPTLALVAAILLTVAIGLVFGAVASRSFGIYFLMLTLTYTVIAFLFVGSVTLIGGFSPVAGVDIYTPGFIGDIASDRQRLYYITLITSVFVYVLVRYLVRTPFGISLQGIRDEPLRMASLGYNVALHRTLAFGIGAFIAALGGVLYAWWFGQLSPTTMGLDATIQMLIIAVIGGLRRIEGAWLGARRLPPDQQRDHEPHPLVGPPGDRRHVQHRHRVHLPRDRHRLARRADGPLGSNVGCRSVAEAARPMRRPRASEAAAVASS